MLRLKDENGVYAFHFHLMTLINYMFNPVKSVCVTFKPIKTANYLAQMLV